MCIGTRKTNRKGLMDMGLWTLIFIFILDPFTSTIIAISFLPITGAGYHSKGNHAN